MFYFFVIYCFLGWCLEEVYAIGKIGHFVNRGFLYGPFCTIYGFGAIFVIIFSTILNGNVIHIFIICLIASSVLEYLTGFVLEKLFNSKWWDYSEDPFNLHGRICAKYSILWGVIGVIIIKVIQPYVVRMVTVLIPKQIGVSLMYILICYFIIDITMTLFKLLEFKVLLHQLEGVTNEIKNRVISLKVTAAEKAVIFEKIPREIREMYGNLEKMPREVFESYKITEKLPKDLKEKLLEIQNLSKDFFNKHENLEIIPKELKEKYEYMVDKIAVGYSRLFKAFPQLNSKLLKKTFKDIRDKITIKDRNSSK